MNFGKPAPLSERVFKKYASEDGKLSLDELKAMVYDMGHCLSDEELKVALVQLDQDNSGSIEYNEFARWWKTNDRFEKLQRSEEELAKINQAVTYFKYFDKDQNGSISSDEFKALHIDLFRNGLTRYDLATCLKDLDTNGDGEIQFNEYINWLIRIKALNVKEVV